MRIVRLLSMALLLAVSAQAQSAKPDFTGVWVLNTARSKLSIPDAPVTSTFIFIHRDPKWHMERTHFFRDRKPNTIAFDRVIGGAAVTTTDGDDVTTSQMFWDGNTVVLDEQMAEGNEHGSNHVTYSLSADANTLIALEIEVFPDAKFTNQWVFDRLPMPAMNDRYPGTGLTNAAFETLKKTIARDHGDCDPKGSKTNVQIDYALINLGALGPGVVTRSSKSCDCGATGNCAIYVYQRHGHAFHEVPFHNDANPSGWAYSTLAHASGHLFLVVGSHMSAFSHLLSFYELVDGTFTNLGGWCRTFKDSSASSEPTKVVIDDCDASKP